MNHDAASPPPSADAHGESSSRFVRHVPRRALASRATGGRDPLGILARQNATRVPELIPLRSERMSASAFAFYRGTAAIMAADQGRDPHSGILVAYCGDAHVSNFGFYASPQRTLVFDLNDFDEAAWAPWEWDLKRLVTSVIIGGRAANRNASAIESAARGTVDSYTRSLQAAIRRSPLERYYSHLDPHAPSEPLHKASRRALRTAIKDAERRTGDRAARRLTRQASDGSRRFVDLPPVTTHVSPEIAERVQQGYEGYRRSAYVDIRTLLSQYTVDDVARRVVGVGSVGTRCYIALLRDPDGGLLIIQAKQAGRSVLEEHGAIPQPHAVGEIVADSGEGARVVGLQRVLQAYSDPFLGHIQMPDGDYYVRQFHDMKGGIDVELLKDITFAEYGAACARVLARAHSQSPTASEVVRYIGRGRTVVDAIVSWCESYADLSAQDYEAFLASLRVGGDASDVVEEDPHH